MSPRNIITVDGPSGAGKGTLAVQLAQHMGYHFLDSGALYRLTALAVLNRGIDESNADVVGEVAANLAIRFEVSDNGLKAFLDDEDVTQAIRYEKTGMVASVVAAHTPVRQALLGVQRHYYRAPGLVADGRDMGTKVFPDAKVKIFLTASAETRAQRRYKQLIDKGESVSLRALLADINERDKRDTERADSPLLPAGDALLLDSSALSIGRVFDLALLHVKAGG
ncbi:(d)CMP kinase [bacterium]|nr:(d)CMP kinase [bacterium]